MRHFLATSVLLLISFAGSALSHESETGQPLKSNTQDRVLLACDKTIEQMDAEIKALESEIARLEKAEESLSDSERTWLDAVKFQLTIHLTKRLADTRLGGPKSDASIKNRRCYLLDRAKIVNSP